MNNGKPIKKYCVKCNTFRIFVDPKIFSFFEKTLVRSIFCGKCGDNNDIIFKEEAIIEIIKILGLIE